MVSAATNMLIAQQSGKDNPTLGTLAGSAIGGVAGSQSGKAPAPPPSPLPIATRGLAATRASP